MAQTKAHKKKRRSQAPIALVYFITMIIFLFVIGMLALYALREFGVIGNDDSNSDEGIKSPVYNTLFARVNSKGVLADATVIRVAPDAKKIIIMPVSAFTVSGSQTMREIHEEGGMVKLEAAVADTFGITIDNYVSLTNDAFENAADIVGGITYTPDEELYYLSQDNDENDIAVCGEYVIEVIKIILSDIRLLESVVYKHCHRSSKKLHITVPALFENRILTDKSYLMTAEVSQIAAWDSDIVLVIILREIAKPKDISEENEKNVS